MRKRMSIIIVAAITLLAACKGKSGGDYEFINNHKNSAYAADSAKIADTVLQSTKLVKTAEINFKVKNVQQTSEHIAVLAKQYGGMVMHHKIQSSAPQCRDVPVSHDSTMRIAAYNTCAEMLIKVPSDKLEEVMTEVSHMGIHINISTMDIEDKTLDYLSARLKLKDREEVVTQQRTGKIRIKDPNEVLSLKDNIVDVRIGNLKTNEAVKFSTIHLNFYQSDTILKETIANDDLSAYHIPVFQRIGLAFASGWSIFMDLLVGLINLWVFILAGIAAWLTYRNYKKRSRVISRPVA